MNYIEKLLPLNFPKLKLFKKKYEVIFLSLRAIKIILFVNRICLDIARVKNLCVCKTYENYLEPLLAFCREGIHIIDFFQ